MSQDILKYELNFMDRVRKRFFLYRLSLKNVDSYNRLPEKLKYDSDVVSAVIALTDAKVNDIPETYLSEILKDKPELINEITDSQKVLGMLKLNPDLLKYVNGNRNLEEMLIGYYEDTKGYLAQYGDSEYYMEIIDTNFPDMDYKVRAVRTLASEFNKEENQYMDDRSQKYYEDEEYYKETETRADKFYRIFMGIYSRLQEDDIKSKMAMISIWRNTGQWKNELEYGDYAFEKVKNDFYNIIWQRTDNDLKKRIDYLSHYYREFDGEQIAKYLNELYDNIDLDSPNIPQGIDEFKFEIISNSFEKLNENREVLWAVNSIDNQRMQLKLLKQYCDLYREDIEDDTKHVMTEILYKEYTNIGSNEIAERLELLYEYTDYVYEDYDPSYGLIAKAKDNPMFFIKDELSALISSYNQEEQRDEKLGLLKKYANKLDGRNISTIISSFDYERYDEQSGRIYLVSDDALKTELLQEYEQNLIGGDIARVIWSINGYREQVQLLERYEKSFNEIDLVNIITYLNCSSEQKMEIIEKYRNKLENKDKHQEAYSNFDIGFSEILTRIIREMDDEGKAKSLEKYYSEMNQNDIMQIVLSIQDENKRQVLFAKYEFNELYNYDLSIRCFNNFGIDPFTIPGNMKIISNDFVNIVGEELVYSFVKYILNGENNTIYSIDTILDNPQLFKEYIDYRKGFMKSKMQQSLELSNLIEEYQRNKDLFEKFSKSNNDDKTNQCMQAIIADGINNRTTGTCYVDEQLMSVRETLIDNVDEIRDYINIRKKYFDTKIQTNPRDTMYELILGISWEEYENLKTKYQYRIGEISETRLSHIFKETMKSMPEESQTNISNMITGLKIIETYEQIIDDEIRRKFLLECNEELSHQFENTGSEIAKIRSSMAEVESDLREYFGKELSSSLFLPENVEETQTIDKTKVIHFKGEDFQCLIHAVDAYGSGNGHYDKREIGNSYLCTSLISSKFMGRAEGNPIVAFSNLPAEAFIHSGPNDIGVKEASGKSKLDYVASDVRCIPSEELLEETVYNDNGYNEIDLYREYYKEDGTMGQLVPDAIVCFNEVDEVSIEEAQYISEQFGLDKPLKIIVIHEECYKEKVDEFKTEITEKYRKKEKVAVSDKVEEMIAQMSEGVPQAAIVDLLSEILKEMRNQELDREENI